MWMYGLLEMFSEKGKRVKDCHAGKINLCLLHERLFNVYHNRVRGLESTVYLF